MAFSVTVPTVSAGAASVRRPAFTAPSGAASVSIALTSVNGASTSSTPTVANLSSTASGCTSGASGLTCTVTVPAQPGTDVFTVTTYSQANGGGSVLGAGNVSVAATSGQTVTAPTTLSGTVASVAITLPATIVPLGVSTTLPVTIVAKDANGNAIIGTYANAITLTDTDASGQTALSATTVPDSTTAAAITLSYKGGAMSAAATIGASASGVSASSVTTVTFSPNGQYPTAGQSLTFTTADSYTRNLYGGTPGPLQTDPPLTITETWSSGATFNGLSGLEQMHHTMSSGETDDEYFQWSIGSISALYFVGETGSYPSVEPTFSFTCQPPYQASWELGATAWDILTGSGPCDDQDTSVYGSSTATDSGVENADGSYTTVTAQSSPTAAFTTTVNSNGSAITTDDYGTSSDMIVMYTPAPNASTIPEYVANFTGPLPSPLPTPGPPNTTVPNWYGEAGLANAQPPSPLETDKVTSVVSVSALPSACAVPASVLGSSPALTAMHEVYTLFDPVAGLYLNETPTVYLLNGVGEVCYVESSPHYIWVQVGLQVENTTQVDYVTQASLQAAMAHGGVKGALQRASFALAALSHAQRRATINRARHDAMLRRAQSIRR